MFALAATISIISVLALYAWGVYMLSRREHEPVPSQPTRRIIEDNWFQADDGVFGLAHEPKAQPLKVLKTYVLREYNRPEDELQVQVGATVYDFTRDEVYNTVIKDEHVCRTRIHGPNGPKDVTHRLIGGKWDTGQHVNLGFQRTRRPASYAVEDWKHSPYGSHHEVLRRLADNGIGEAPTPKEYPTRLDVDMAEVENLYEVETTDSQAATGQEVYA